MLLPSGFQPQAGILLGSASIATGMYAVEDAYKGEYDFFAPSPLFETATDVPTTNPVHQEMPAPIPLPRPNLS
jgi:hypothetical protein